MLVNNNLERHGKVREIKFIIPMGEKITCGNEECCRRQGNFFFHSKIPGVPQSETKQTTHARTTIISERVWGDKIPQKFRIRKKVRKISNTANERNIDRLSNWLDKTSQQIMGYWQRRLLSWNQSFNWVIGIPLIDDHMPRIYGAYWPKIFLKIIFLSQTINRL